MDRSYNTPCTPTDKNIQNFLCDKYLKKESTRKTEEKPN